jgi:hypothetical protein
MIARALGVSFRQALRSVALTLFPLAFIALFAWASAGSTSGNTSDPVRASAWLYLGVHLIPFSIPGGKLTVLPLLAVLYPMWAIRRGLPNVESAFNKLNGARIIYSLWYAFLSEILALISIFHGAHANLYLTPTFTFIIAMIATATFAVKKNRAFYFALYLFTIALGIGSLVYAWSLFQHWSEIKSISVILGSGIVGGVLTAAIQLLYLPNIALASISYLTGIGFSFGAGSVVSGTQITLGQVPALPFVAGLPTSTHPALQYATITWLFIFILLFLFIAREGGSLAHLTGYWIVQGVRIFIAVALFAYLSAGELFRHSFDPVGVIWWKFSAFLGIAFLIAAVLTLYLPALLRKVVKRG